MRPEEAKKAERQSNLELLRIIAMLLIVAGHFAVQGGLIWAAAGKNQLFIMLAGSGQRVAVNMFLMIGAWFMVDAEFRASRILKLYGETAFYAVTITLLMVLSRADVPKQDIVRVAMPFFGRPLWFASAYISLLAAAPFLKKVLAWEQGELRRLLLVLFVLLSMASTVPGYKESYVADLCWCMYIYLFIGAYKRNGHQSGGSRWLLLTGGLGIYAALVLSRWLCTIYSPKYPFLSAGVSLAEQYISDIRSVPNFLCALMVFLFFLRTDIGRNKAINHISKSAFAVYAIHAVPAFHDFLWYRIYRCGAWRQSGLVCLYFTGVVLSVYIAASLIDRIRIKWIEPAWLKSRLFCSLCRYLDGFYKTT